MNQVVVYIIWEYKVEPEEPNQPGIGSIDEKLFKKGPDEKVKRSLRARMYVVQIVHSRTTYDSLTDPVHVIFIFKLLV